MAFIHSPKIVTDGLVLYLDAGNRKSYPGSGTAWNDVSGNGNSGTLTNGPTFSSTNGGSIVFDGVNDYVNVSVGSNFPVGSAERTLCSVFNVSSVTGGREIFGIGNNAYDGSRSALWIDDSNIIGIECRSNGVLTSDWSGINTWVYLCAVLPSGQTNVHSFNIYVNGVQKTTSTSGTNVTLNTTNTACVVGTVPGATSAHMVVGNVSSVQLYNRALSATEILQNYNATRSRFGV